MSDAMSETFPSGNHMWILDGESNDVVERFPVALIQQPTAFNDHNHIYNNILIFTIQMPNESQGIWTQPIASSAKPWFATPGELHIFQCVSHNAINIVEDIQQWMRHLGVTSTASAALTGEPSVQPNVNVKEAVSVFNQIAAQREKLLSNTTIESTYHKWSDRKGSSPTGGVPIGHPGHVAANHDPDSRSITTNSSIDSNHHNGAHRSNSQDQVWAES